MGFDIEQEVARFKRGRDNAAALLAARIKIAADMAARFGVLVYVIPSRKGLVIDTARPQVSNAWRVAPSGTVTQVSSGE